MLVIVCKILRSHILVSIRLKPRKLLRVFIQLPGLGKNLIRPGKIPVRRNGNASPIATNVKIRMMIRGPWVKANASAVPKNGAEQGVDKIVASTPFRKSPRLPFVSIEPSSLPPGVLNSKSPNILRLKINNTPDIKSINNGD